MSKNPRRDYRMNQPFVIKDKRTLAFVLTALRFTERCYVSPDHEDMILTDPWDTFGLDLQPLDIASFDDIADRMNDSDFNSDAGFWRPGRKAHRRRYTCPLG